MFSVVIDIDGDQFNPCRTQDLRLTGKLPFAPTESTKITPVPPGSSKIGFEAFDIKTYYVQWNVEGEGAGYFYTRGSLECDISDEQVIAAFHPLGWSTEDGDVC